MQEESKFEKDENGLLQYVPARNDPLINKYNEYIIQFWRGNMDIAPVLSEEALIEYLVKYIGKSEIASSIMEELSTILQNYNNEDLVKGALQKLFIRVCAQRDFSAQEVCHLLLSLKLYSSGGRQFVYIFTNKSSEWIQINNDASTSENETTQKFGSSFLEKYRDRAPHVEHITLWEAATEYNAKDWKKSKTKKVAVVFPKYSMSQSQSLTEEYCQQQMMLHIPWRCEKDLKPDASKTWKDTLLSSNLSNNNHSTINICPSAYESDNEDLQDSDPDDLNPQEEWMLLSGLGPDTQIPTVELGLRETDLIYDWNQSARKYEQYGSLPEIQTFITRKKTAEQNYNEHVDFDYSTVQLNAEQQSIIDLLLLQIKSFKIQKTICPTRVIVQGKAGTGKSFIIKAITSIIHQELGPDYLLKITPTGVTAIAIKGQTAQSALNIPINSQKFKPLTGQAARNFCNKYQNVKFLIIDEFSMVGSTLFAEIEQRCKEFTGNSIDDFGNLFVYMFGDVCQLPPVRDTPLYRNSQISLLRVYGKQIFDRFDGAFVLTKSVRQTSAAFEEILDRLSKGQNTLSDYNTLQQRFTSSVSQEIYKSFKDAIHLYPTTASVKEYNLNVLSKLIDSETKQPVPVARIKSKNNSKQAAKASPDDADGLQDVIYLAKGCRVMLRTNLWTTKGLVNGAIGHVTDILFQENDSYPNSMPLLVLCDFPSYSGPPFIQGTTVVPIPPVTKSWDTTNGAKCSRTQFPLQVCYACSIHKSQGLTLDQAFVNLGESEFSLGLSYVVLSRVKAIEGLLIEPFCYDRIKKLSTFELMKHRIKFEEYLTTLHEKTQELIKQYKLDK